MIGGVPIETGVVSSGVVKETGAGFGAGSEGMDLGEAIVDDPIQMIYITRDL